MKSTTARRSPLLTILLAAMLLPACVLPPTEADLQTYQVVAPAHAAYVQADPAMAPDQKQRRLDLLESWRIRVGAPKQ